MADATPYDVFLSFKGETRDTFSDQLYEALGGKALDVFRDTEEIDKGEKLKPEIEKAIKASKASIVVLSKNYATSTWCLDELWLILQQRKEGNHFVYPIFYHVDTSDVRKQNGTFKIQVKTSTYWTYDNVNRWKAALTEIADLSGCHIVSGLETKFVRKIVDTIYRKLDDKKISLPPNVIGMDIRYNEITSWLYKSDLKYLAIYGMGGSGKTTLAKHIYNKNWKNFENMSFIADIGQYKESRQLLEPQKQLLTDILGGKKRKIPSVSHGTPKIEEVLNKKKALIVLDDVVENKQLDILLGTRVINSESKIIITTEKKPDCFKFLSSSCLPYEMKLLDDDESLELLSLHAFGCKNPKEGFKDLAVKAVKHCAGNPLALEVFGQSLGSTITIRYWKSQLRALSKNFRPEIQNVLRRGYDSLSTDEQKLFLHIACFFIGKDVFYVENILEPDCCAESGIKTLTDRCLISASPNNQLMMHQLLQEMGKSIVCQESIDDPLKRSRVWLSYDSYKILKKGKGSETIIGLTLDREMLTEEEEEMFKSSDHLKTDAFEMMDNLKLLQLNSVELTGSYEKFSVDIRWLCWLGFHLRTLPSGLYMGKMVALDMSYSKLEVFDPPMVLKSLKILNLKDSHKLFEICNIKKIPRLETLILWNCHSLVHVCETIGDLKDLTLLNMTGCHSLCKREKNNLLEASTSGGVTEQAPFSFPLSLQRLFLNNCNLECTYYFPLSFSVQPSLQYLNLSNGLFESLPCYDHLKDLRVLDLSFCARLKCLLCLPSTLAELYIYYCVSLEKITFQSAPFMLQEFGYEGCISLSEIQGFLELVPIAKLDETDMEHLKWLKKYQSHEILLVGDDELTVGRSLNIQMLYEFNIRSTSLPDIEDSNMTPDYTSKSPLLSFDVPSYPNIKKLVGLNVTFKYTISGGDDWAFFAKISTNKGVDLMYNPRVFGKPGSGEVGIWLSYWPIGSALDIGDTVNVCIVMMCGLEVHECGASLVYTEDDIVEETLRYNMGLEEILGGDISGFKLSTGAYYLCRRDFFELIEVGRLTRDWFRVLVGDTINYTEVQGWRKTGRPKQLNPSFTELKMVRCIIHGPESEEIYKIAEMYKSPLVDKTIFTSNILGETMKSGTTSEVSYAATKEKSESYNLEPVGTSKAFVSEETPMVTDEVGDEAVLTTVADSKGFDVSSYDVFLSFRGEDTRDSFMDHLYDALGRSGLITFRDNDEIDRGEELKPEIEKAIKGSKASLVVLSEHYATSTWCLEELWLILEQRREFNHFVLPVFYHVDPSTVRKQDKTFKIEVKTSSKWTHDNVKRWREALVEVTNFKGFVVSGSESKFLKEIVDTISNVLDHKKAHLPDNLIGMDTRYKEITYWLYQSNLQYLVICGMGGSGKTTLAKYIYSSNWQSFENMSFLEDIGRKCKVPHDLLMLQEQLVRDILGGGNKGKSGVSLEMALQMKKALIVLDEIVEYSVVVALLGTGKINAQSKIIVTTENVDNWFNLSPVRFRQYQMPLLSDDESMELLSYHAFGSKIMVDGLKELAVQAVKYCEGNPLALEVVGSSLSEDISIPYWKSQLEAFKKEIHPQIQDVLKWSYDSLPYGYQRELFLHIACFFIGEDVDYVVKILEPDYFARSEIQRLINTHLLSVSPSKKLAMHRLFQEMGKNLVRQESSKRPEKRSRIWRNSDSYNILSSGMGSETIEGLALDMIVLREEEEAFKSPGFMTTKALEKMDNLKLLKLNFVRLVGSYENFSAHLRWLSWHGFHLRTIPSGLYMGKMVALDMSYSKLEVFDPPMALPSLQILNLQESDNLVEIRNISKIPNLEIFILSNCHSLIHVHETMEVLKNLTQLNMTGCENYEGRKSF